MTLSTIRPGDIIEVDKKGRKFHALVSHVDSGAVDFRPLGAGISYRSATAREVVGHWRASKSTRVAKGLAS